MSSQGQTKGHTRTAHPVGIGSWQGSARKSHNTDLTQRSRVLLVSMALVLTGDPARGAHITAAATPTDRASQLAAARRRERARASAPSLALTGLLTDWPTASERPTRARARPCWMSGGNQPRVDGWGMWAGLPRAPRRARARRAAVPGSNSHLRAQSSFTGTFACPPLTD